MTWLFKNRLTRQKGELLPKDEQIKVSSGSSSGSLPPYDFRGESLQLVLKMQGNPNQVTSISARSKNDVKCVVAFLDHVLHDREIMPGTDNDSHEFIQSLLTRIMTATGVVPDFHHYLTQFRGYLKHHGQGDHEEIVFPSEKGRKYRVRKVRGRLNGDEEALKDQFIKGHGLLFHLYHPNVVPIYGTFRDGTDMCFVSPSIPGCSLHEYLKSASPGFVERKLLISDVVNGLEYLHRHDIVHGDLRLDTILISDDGRALLGDFVVARIENGKGAVATEPNTRPMRWRPPESFDTYKSRYGWKPSPMVGDVWQFGCVCYTIITNEQPFERYWTDKRVKQALQARELPGRRLQTGESSRFWGMIEKCWRSFEREGSLSPRPSSAEQLKKLLPSKFPCRMTGGTTVYDDTVWNYVRSEKMDFPFDYLHVHDILKQAFNPPSF